MLVIDFTKEIRFQLTNDTLKNPWNCQKKVSNNVGEYHTTKDVIKGYTCSEKGNKL